MLDDRQKNAVRKWAADGAGLSEIQRRIKDEFGISMTYMDVRFLMLDIDAVVKDKPEPKTPPPAPSAASADAGEAPRQDGEGALDDNLADGAAPAARNGRRRQGGA